MSWVGALLLGAAVTVAVAGGFGSYRWRRRRGWLADLRNPAVDPGRRPTDPWDPAPADLSVEDVRRRLDASDRDLPYRAPLQPLAHTTAALAALGAPGLAAEVLARLGHVDEALALAATLPADDAAACWVRHLGYVLAGDDSRAEAALVAAVCLAPPADRGRYLAGLGRWRRDRPRFRSEAERLWDP